MTEIQPESAYLLVLCLAAANEVAPHKTVCFVIFAVLDEVLYLLDVVCAALLVVVAGARAPYRTLVDVDELVGAVAVDHCTDTAVSQRERLIEGFIVVECVVGVDVACHAVIAQDEVVIVLILCRCRCEDIFLLLYIQTAADKR